jgi:KipI family sensor histidine kinase inhibitor
VISPLLPRELERLLLPWDPSIELEIPSQIIEVPIRYDGPDLRDVAKLWGLSVREVIELHTSTTFTCSFCGFLPGFAYLTGLSEQYAVRRRSTPRVELPAGSVGFAGTYCGIYPRPSPGGWQIIGHTSFQPWDEDLDPPGRITPGTRVQFLELQ